MQHAFTRLAPLAIILFFVLAFAVGCALPKQAALTATPLPTATASPTPSPTPTPSPSPTPTPVPTPTPMPPPGDAYYDAFFNDTIIIGDSITGGLRNYVIRERASRPTLLGDAAFYASAKYGLQHAASLTKKRMPYNGNGVTLPYLLRHTGAKKVFIMLGLNNWAGAQIEKCIELYRQTVENLRKEDPNVLIFLESCTPVVKTGEREKINNDNLDAFNAELRGLCRELGVFYVDVATPLKGDDNAMCPAYSKDGYVHMSPEGAAVWVDALYQFAYDAAQAGWYTPEKDVSLTPLPVREPAESYIPPWATPEPTTGEEQPGEAAEETAEPDTETPHADTASELLPGAAEQ